MPRPAHAFDPTRAAHRRARTFRAPAVALGAVASAAVLSACEVVRERGTDTVRVVDTVARVDTVVRRDTVFVGAALGFDADLPAAADSARAIPAPDPGPPDPGLLRGSASAGAAAPPAAGAVPGGRQFLVPVAGVRAAAVPDTFDEPRGGGARRHEAVDILAPRGTAVVSAAAGRVAKLHTSQAGGLSVYAADPSGRYMLYYAHLDAYHPRLREGLALARGDTIGFVGSTGNAARDVPHLHFALSELADPRQWWKGTPIDPRPLITDE